MLSLAIYASLLTPTPFPQSTDSFDAWARDVIWVDFDADGLEDLYVAGAQGPDRLLLNRGDGSFEDAADQRGLEGSSRSGLFVDMDRDGALDFVRLFGSGRMEVRRGTGGVLIEDTTTFDVAELTNVQAVRAFDFDRDGWQDLWVERTDGVTLLRNLAGAELEPVTLGPVTPGAGTLEPVVSVTGTQTSALQKPPEESAPDRNAGSVATEVPAGQPHPHSMAEPTLAPDPIQVGRPSSPARSRKPVSTGPALQPFASTTPGSFGPDPRLAALACARFLVDMATNNCVPASSDGGAGTIPVQDVDFNVNGNRVGMGTLNPQKRLHVSGGDVRVDGGQREIQLMDADGEFGVRLFSSASGDVNDVALYDDGELSRNERSHAFGHHQIYRNTGSGHIVFQGGIDRNDGGAFLEGKAVIPGVGAGVVFELEADLDDTVNQTGQGNLMLRSTGPAGVGGQIELQNNDGTPTLTVRGGPSADGSTLEMSEEDGDRTVLLESDTVYGGVIEIGNGNTPGPRVRIEGNGSFDDGGEIQLYAGGGSSTILLDAHNLSEGGLVSVSEGRGIETIRLVGDNSNDSGRVTLYNRSEHTIAIDLEARDPFGTGGRILMSARNGAETVEIDSDDGNVGQILLKESDGSSAFAMSISSLTLWNSAGSITQTYNRQTGTKSAVIATADHGDRLYYAVEATGVWLEDFGRGQLSKGSARIDLDPIFVQSITVDGESPLHVDITLNGESEAVFVEAHADHFVVRERNGGTGHAGFTWRAMAKRRGLEHTRLQPVEEQFRRQVGDPRD